MAARPKKTNADVRPIGPTTEASAVSETDRSLISCTMREILSGDAPAAAKAQAARVLAELGGLLGKHQDAPARLSQPLSGLSRAELERELVRLRDLTP